MAKLGGGKLSARALRRRSAARVAAKRAEAERLAGVTSSRLRAAQDAEKPQSQIPEHRTLEAIGSLSRRIAQLEGQSRGREPGVLMAFQAGEEVLGMTLFRGDLIVATNLKVHRFAGMGERYADGGGARGVMTG